MHQLQLLGGRTNPNASMATQVMLLQSGVEHADKNDSKIESKTEPRQQPMTLTKHAQALTDCMATPLREFHFSSLLKHPYQITNN